MKVQVRFEQDGEVHQLTADDVAVYETGRDALREHIPEGAKVIAWKVDYPDPS